MRTRTIKPYVGLLCTICIGSDRYASTVNYVSPSGKTIYVSHGCMATWVTMPPAKDGLKFMLKPYRDYNGKPGYRWKVAGRNSGYGIYFGKADDYLDPSF